MGLNSEFEKAVERGRHSVVVAHSDRNSEGPGSIPGAGWRLLPLFRLTIPKTEPL